MMFAYADPPYPGMGHFYCGREVNHRLLIAYLESEFDGWALSTASTTLKQVLSVAPDDIRIAAWVKPFASFKPNVPFAYTWEPVLIRSQRSSKRFKTTVADYCAVNITLKRGFVGAKPEAFCHWLFDAMGMTRDDEFLDVFPGSGAVSKAWAHWKSQRGLPFTEVA